MRSLIPLLLAGILTATLLFIGCDDSEVVDPNDYPLPEAGVFISDTLEYTQLFAADTSPGGDVFILATDMFGTSPAEDYGLHVLRISPYGQTLFETDGEEFLATDLRATADYGCVGSGTPAPMKYNSDGDIDWLLNIPATSALPRPDGSVIFAGHASEYDTLIHVTAVNALGITLWSTGFDREDQELATGATLMPNGDIALLLQKSMPSPTIPYHGISRVRVISADGSTQHSSSLTDPHFVNLMSDFVALADDGFAAWGSVANNDFMLEQILVVWDADGSIAWYYSGSESAHRQAAIAPADDGGLFLLTLEPSVDPIKLRRFDTSGNVLWTREYGESFPNQTAYPLDIVVLGDNLVQISYFRPTDSLTEGLVAIVREEIGQ